MLLLRRIISISTACGITCGVSGMRAKERERSHFYCNLWKFKSCGDFLFPASAPGYFVLRFPEIRSASLPVCVCFSCLTTKSSQSSQHCLVWYSQQLKHIPRFTHFFLLVLSVCTTSSRCQCHKGRPGIQCMPRFVRLTGCCSMMHVWGGQREDYDYKKGSVVVMCFPV